MRVEGVEAVRGRGAEGGVREGNEPQLIAGRGRWHPHRTPLFGPGPWEYGTHDGGWLSGS